jgi:phosphate transport system substrate-binding protein
MQRLWLNAGMLLVAAVLAVGCGGEERGAGNDSGSADEVKTTITQKGSDTMILIAQKWAEVFGADNTNVTIQVTGGGSGTGISALINGTTDIANASRPMKDAEREEIKSKYGNDVVEIPVAKDAVAVYISEENPVKELTIEQLGKIYTKQITNWKEVGGNDAPIILYGRENSSGTYEFFKEHVLDGADFAAETQTLQGTAAIVNAVSKDANGIGYGGAAYTASGVKQAAVGHEGQPMLIADAANVASGEYALSRPLFFYLRQQPTGAIKQYIDWVLSRGQEVIIESKLEYFPLNQTASAAPAAADTSTGSEG